MIRVGILGTARIAPRILDRPASGARIDAVASRDPAKAREFAAKYGIPRAYGSYEELLGDPSLDAVYMPLPQHLHCEFTVKAAAAGKHVLVEKPAAMSVAEVRRMEDACTAAGVLYMEAFMYRFMRVHQRAREIAQSGTIGKIRRVVLEWAFNFGLVKRSAFKFDRSLGGGALYDLGIYGIDFLRFITGDEPRLLRAVMQRRSGTGIDEYTRAEFMLGDVHGSVGCGFDTDINYYAIGGELGAIYSPIALSGQSEKRVLNIHLIEGDRWSLEEFPPEDPYVAELEYFARCIDRREQPVPGFANSLSNMARVEEILDRAEQIEGR